jgi:hypothetical protein
MPERNLYLLNPIVERNGVTLPRVDRSILEEAIRDCDVVHTTFVLRLSHTAVKIAKAYNKPITSSFHCQAENVTAHFLQGLGRHQPRRVPRVLSDGVPVFGHHPLPHAVYPRHV